MYSIQLTVKNSVSAAFSRLQVWFDPAQTGSPYETLTPRKTSTNKKQYPFFTKRLSIRM
jgi:hypothetical protein